MPGFVVQKSSVVQLNTGVPNAGAALENGELWDIIRPLNDVMNISEGQAQYDASVAQFSKQQRAAHAVVWYVSDVQNGGHWQFFYNTTGILWEAAQKGLREIGAGENSLILSAAALRAGGAPPYERASRQSLMKRLSPKFTDLDARLNRSDPLSILMGYIQEHRAAFGTANPKNV